MLVKQTLLFMFFVMFFFKAYLEMHKTWIYQNTTVSGPEFSSGVSKGNLLIWRAFQTEKWWVLVKH